MKLFLKVQLLDLNSPEEMRKRTNELRRFCRFFHLRVQLNPSSTVPDTFLIHLPDDPLLLGETVNALSAYCHYHRVSARLATEKVLVPFDFFLKSLSDN